MKKKNKFDPFASPNLSDVMPMTPSQRELWMGAQQSPEASCAYNLSISIMLDGQLDLTALEGALQQLVDRHSGLRASFSPDSLSMCIADSLDVALPVADLREIPDEDQQLALDEFLRKDVETPFDLVFGPLWRFHLFRFAETESRLVFTVHHLIADGWTVDLLVKELAALYSSTVTGKPSGLPPAFQFRDYSEWLEKEYASDVGLEADSFWLDKFKTKAPVLELPVDRPRNRVRTFSAARTELVLDPELSTQIFTTATRLKSTFFIFAFSNYVAFLNRITGQDDFVVAVPAAGQLDVGENLLAGHCVNTLPVRCEPKDDKAFADFMAETRRNIYSCNAHTPFTFGNLMGRIPMERDASRPPLASTLITVDQEGHNLEFEGLSSHYRLNPRAFEMFELQIALVAQKDKIEIQCQYNTDLFDKQTAERRMREFATLLKETARDPQQKVSDIDLLAAEDAEMIAAWNDTGVEYRTNCTLQGLFAEQVAKTPKNIALEFLDETITYAEFDSRSNQLANYLLEQGVEPGQAVGVCTERSFEMLISLYAVLKVGAAYVPLDPDYPKDRLDFILDDCGAEVILTHNVCRDLLENVTGKVFSVDTDWQEAASFPTTRPEDKVSSSDLAYIIYTSGSTGKPKGVMNEHGGICNQLFWMQEKFSLDGTDRILLKTPYSFDVSIWELFFPLLNGARIVIAPPDAHRDPQQLSQIFRDSHITGTCFVPSLLAAYLSSETEPPNELRWIISIGEAMTPDLQSRFMEQLPDVELHNLYGPTEAAVAVTHWLCNKQEGARSVPIGRPFANVAIYILDASKQQVPIGVSGELYIGGIQVARGYHNRDELNAEVFVDDPFSQTAGAQMYKTGDLARWTNEGVIEYLGRVDFQVKFAGLRIELGEIESILEDHDAVDNSVVVVHEPNTESQKLVAYFSANREVEVGNLREHLGKTLPQYMIPQLFMQLDALPLNTAGKVDRKSLPEPQSLVSKKVKTTPVQVNDVERVLIDAWAEFLGSDEIPLTETFFDLGGTSLQALRLVAQLSKALEINIAVIKFFEYPTIAQFADWLREQGDLKVPATVDEKPQEVVVELSAVRNTHSRDVAIVGVAGSFPEAKDVDTFWRNLLETRDSISHFSVEDIDENVDPQIASRPNYVRARGVMPDADKFDAELFGIRPREAQIMDPQVRVFMETCWHALEDAAIDAEHAEGKIGIFAGAGDNTYLLKYVLRDNSAIEAVGEHQVHILNERDFLTSRVAYKLGLRGPAVSVSTACSTSLVAICHAVESIRAGQCETALAGGVSIPAPQNAGYLFQEGGIGSKDGKCRPFDSQASGTVFSSGSGAVVLRRRDIAEANGDRIYGVIRGVALNNDGSDKMSFMAPSASGQRDVIASALTDAGVDGNNVSYVEAHGTATPIGDPIEFSALTSAYGISKAGERWLGSVKGNIGHLDTAAGIAGFIKLAKVLQTGLLPATANFETPNPEINLEEFGFSVPNSTFNWRSHRDSICAGISSFGIGGTNAHAIVESPPSAGQMSVGRSQELIILSADSGTQLQELGGRVSHYLDALDSTRLSDAAYTLARGRKRLDYRAFASGSVDEIRNSFADIQRNCVVAQPLANPDVAFLFTGQGSQHLGMGKGLYEHSDIFRDVFDDGASYLADRIGVDLRDLLFRGATDDKQAAKLLVRTDIAQPALYLLEYAMACHWMDWDVKPSVVAGHSIGEFAAATVAGIMSFETGLKLVEARGRLIHSQEPGRMLSVRAAKSVIEPFLCAEVSLAAINGPEMCVVSGPNNAIADLARRFEQSGILAKALQTSHAFHSAMMEPAREAFEDIVASCNLTSPAMTFVSTLTGQAITDSEAVSPVYWGRQLRQGVNLSGAIDTLWTGRKPILLEIGPRASLTTLAKQHVNDAAKERAVATLDGSDDAVSEWKHVLAAAGTLWTYGKELDWQKVYSAGERRVISMPGYPFRRTRYWMGEQVQATKSKELAQEVSTHSNQLTDQLCALIERGSGFSLSSSDFNRTFIDIGLDSLYLTQFGIQLQNEFGVHVGLRDLIDKVSSIAKLAEFIRANTDTVVDVSSNAATTLVSKRRSVSPAHLPPCDGAFVGQDQNGVLAWYREVPDQPGKFEKLRVA